MAFKNLFESPEEEVARLAASPAGSINHYLSTLPVRITGSVEDLMIELPGHDGDEHSIVVVPFRARPSRRPGEAAPFQRHRHWWDCLVVASNHPAYPVGGHRISIPEYELVRGIQRELELSV